MTYEGEVVACLHCGLSVPSDERICRACGTAARRGPNPLLAEPDLAVSLPIGATVDGRTLAGLAGVRQSDGVSAPMADGLVVGIEVEGQVLSPTATAPCPDPPPAAAGRPAPFALWTAVGLVSALGIIIILLGLDLLAHAIPAASATGVPSADLAALMWR